VTWPDDRHELPAKASSGLSSRDTRLEYFKTDPLLDPLRKESRFQAIERELRFPDGPAPALAHAGSSPDQRDARRSGESLAEIEQRLHS
jgi:hypothetical protein